MPMTDDFRTPLEDQLEIGPHKGRKFSHHIWNNKLLPLARSLCKLQHVKRVRVDFDETKGPTYGVIAWTYIYGGGWVFDVRPIANGVKVTGRDLSSNAPVELNGWNDILYHVKTTKAAPAPDELAMQVCV
jgi:hypothetical protein